MIFFFDKLGNSEIVYGIKIYLFYEFVVLKLNLKVIKKEYNKSWEFFFEKYNLFIVKEFFEFLGILCNESEKLLNEILNKGILEKIIIKNGIIWILKKNK